MNSPTTTFWKGAVCLAALAMLAGPTLAQEVKGDQAEEAVEDERLEMVTDEGAEAAAQEEAPAGLSDEETSFDERLEMCIQKATHPVEWFEWGGDIRLRTVWANNNVFLNGDNPRHENHYQRYRGRLWGTLRPHEDVDVNVRFAWEPRVIQKPPTAGSKYIWDEVVIDQMNVVWRDIADLPVAVKAGRQDIIFGDGWLVLDGTPLDGSRTIYFNAVRTTVGIEDLDTVLDVIYLQNDDDGDMWVRPFNQTGQPVIEQDERGVIVYAQNSSWDKACLEGYYIYKHDEPRAANGYDADVHTLGARVFGDLGDQWKYVVEAAPQFGERNGEQVHAFGFRSEARYFVLDDYNNNFRAEYEFLSGDDPGSSTDESFDLLWGRWPQFSEILIRSYVLESRIAQVTNMHRLAAGWSFNPTDKLEVSTDYHLLFADENNNTAVAGFSRNGAFRGQLLASWLRYRISKHVSGHFLVEAFFPGGYYTDLRNDPAIFARYELQFTW